MSNYLRLYQAVGWKGVLKHLYTFRAIKEGTLVGVDELGNKYYENNSLPYGQHRWYEPKQYENPNLHEASSVCPAWHGWLHCAFDQPPTQGKDRTGKDILNHSDAPFTTHTVGTDLQKPWRPNPTLRRVRGFNVPTYQSEVQGENAFYTQSGHPQSPVYQELPGAATTWKPTPIPASERSKADLLPPTKWEKFQLKREEMNKKAA